MMVSSGRVKLTMAVVSEKYTEPEIEAYEPMSLNGAPLTAEQVSH